MTDEDDAQDVNAEVPLASPRNPDSIAKLRLLLDFQKGLFETQRRAEDSVNQRAALLVSGSAINSALQQTTSVTCWDICALAASLLAAVIGVIALRSQKTAAGKADVFYEDVQKLAVSETAFMNTVFITQNKVFENREQRLKREKLMVQIGFIFLVLSVLVSFIKVISRG